MTQYWLIKSEPSIWSWTMQEAAGTKGTRWDGVRNHLAKQHLIAMKRGDQAFFYHSNEGKEIAGIVEIIREHYPDPTATPGEAWVAVDVKALRTLPQPVTLAQIKVDPELADMALIKAPRLSVQPVKPAEWQSICEMAGA